MSEALAVTPNHINLFTRPACSRGAPGERCKSMNFMHEPAKLDPSATLRLLSRPLPAEEAKDLAAQLAMELKSFSPIPQPPKTLKSDTLMPFLPPSATA